ncbi:MAG: bifunctional DNA primase/polymerase [Planctomycetota bacterium]
MLDAALAYARAGLPVFPIAPGGKLPAIPSAHPKGDPQRGLCHGECGRDGHGFHDATTDETRIRAWWETWPDANIGLRAGEASGFDVVDLDTQKGGEGADASEDLPLQDGGRRHLHDGARVAVVREQVRRRREADRRPPRELRRRAEVVDAPVESPWRTRRRTARQRDEPDPAPPR